jgi:hypothetical protein
MSYEQHNQDLPIVPSVLKTRASEECEASAQQDLELQEEGKSIAELLNEEKTNTEEQQEENKNSQEKEQE